MSLLPAILLVFAGVGGEAPRARVLALMLKARYAMATYDIQSALDFVGRAYSVDPDNPEVIQLKLEVEETYLFRSREDKQRWLVEVRNAVARFPDDYRFPKMIGVFLAENPEYISVEAPDEPFVMLEKALELLERSEGVHSVDGIAVYQALGDIYSFKGKPYDAAVHYQKITELDPHKAQAWKDAGEALAASHQLRSALTHFQRWDALADGRKNRQTAEEIAYRKCLVEAQLDPNPDNVARLIEIVQRGQFHNATLLQLANQFISVGLHEQALSFLHAVPEEKRSSNYFYYRILFRIRMKDHNYQALALEIKQGLARELSNEVRDLLEEYALESSFYSGDYDTVIQLAGAMNVRREIVFNVGLYRALAVFLKDGDLQGWRTFTAGHPNNRIVAGLADSARILGLEAMLTQQVARLYLSYSDWDNALAFYRRALARADDTKPLRLEVADAYAVSGDVTEAVKRYEAILLEEPDHQEVLNNYGYFLAENGRELERARSFIERAWKQEPGNGAYLDSMGWVSYKLGHLEEAERFLLQALETNPDDAEKLEHLGDIYHALGKQESARRHWSAAMSFSETRYFDMLDKLDPP